MMFKKRMRRGVPPLNTTSTADISFMLLIFFLVTTSMGADKGIKRELPPLNPQEQQTAAVREGAVMHVDVMDDGTVRCDDQSVSLGQLKNTFKKFVEDKGLEHVFRLRCSREASYATYYQVQNALQSAYRELREARAQEAYKCSYEQCTDAQRRSVDKAVPQRIAEDYDAGKEVQP